ncbi:MAG: B12-binding domain-containing radical SAM protein [Fibrobacterota bacterium]
MGFRIILTCDRTMASDYHGLLFLGFSACLPTGTLPDWLYYPLFCPNAPADSEGRLLRAPYGLRKIEAALHRSGFTSDDVAVIHPDHINSAVDDTTEVLAISSNDPLGIGPATSTFVELWGGEGRMAQKLRELLQSPAVQKHRPFIFLGGPGAWQLSVNPEKRRDLGINCAMIGEGEVTAPRLIKKVLAGEKKEILPVEEGAYVPDKDLPAVVHGSITGLIEVTRGCARSCAFCVPTVRKVRSRPIREILKEVEVNLAAGNTGVLLHGEDILLYNSDGLRVNSSAVVELFERVIRHPGVQWAGASHASLSSAAYAPEAVAGISRALGWGQKPGKSGYFQVGIETGSPRLIGRHMKGKVYPFQPREWPDVVQKGMKVLHENSIVASATLILGLPGETDEDIRQTITLVKKLSPCQSIIVPLLFASMETSKLAGQQSLTKDKLTPLHHELIGQCWLHNLKWLPHIWNMYGRNSGFFVKYGLKTVMKLGIPIVRQRIFRGARKKGAALSPVV